MPKIAEKPAQATRPATSTTKPSGKKPAKKEVVQRPVVYPDVRCLVFQGEKALTAQQAKDFLGWTAIESGESDLEDELGNKIKLAHNIGNRAFKPLRCRMYMQLILNRQWEFNLEAMIIGRTGLVISAQHRLAALILAVQEWEKNKDKWPQWKTEPTLECIINVGCDESDRVVNTIDTGEPRSFSDVVYRSHYFANVPANQREKLASMTDRAVLIVEHRTGARKDAFSSKRPHAEGIEFLDAHPSILKCVKHIAEEDGSKKGIGYYLPAGYAAGLMYLMSAGKTEAVKYVSSPTEKAMNLDNMDLASTFFVELAQGNPRLSATREQASMILHECQRITRNEAFALLIKSWLLWSVKKTVTDKDLQLTYHVDPDDGMKSLRDFPTVGGIDVGEIDLLAAIANEREEDDPTQEEIDARAAQVRADRDAKLANGKQKYKPKAGDTVFVEEDGGVFSGEVVELYSDQKKGLFAKLKMKNGKEVDVPAKDCLSYNPQVA